MNNRGSVLVLTIAMIAVLSTLAIAYSSRIFNEHSVMLKTVYSTQAFWIAEAGIQKAAWDFDRNQCRGMTNQGTGQVCVNCDSCGTGTRIFTGSLNAGDFSVTFDPSTKTYVATGSAYRGTGTNKSFMASRKIQVLFGQDPIFGYAAFSDGEMTIRNNSRVDSYNSNNAVYALATSGSRGNMGTNGTSVNVIDIGNNSTIQGVVSTGPGGTVDYMPSKVAITGGITHTNDVYLEPVSVPSALQSAAYLGTLSLATGTIDLTAGKYRYDSVIIGNDGTININGDVELYLTNTATAFQTGNNLVAININAGASLKIYSEGKVDFGNKATINNLTTNKATKNLMIFSLYDDTTDPNGVIIGNNNEFYGAIYAPLTNVTVSNNSAFYGSVVGKEVDLNNNGTMHYDEALSLIGAPWQPAELRDWQEKF
jgi:Tfp pilus assembly protein PilX